MANDIPPDFTKGMLQNIPDIRTVLDSCPECRAIEEPEYHHHITSKGEVLITPLELALNIQDPCGLTAINLAREVLKLITDREDDGICQSLIHEMQKLNSKYTRG